MTVPSPNLRGNRYLLAPAPLQAFETSSGNTYTADANGYISITSLMGTSALTGSGDYLDLLKSGCIPYVPSDYQLLGVLKGVSMLATGYSAFTMFTPAGANWRVGKITATNLQGASAAAAVITIQDSNSGSGGTLVTSQTLTTLSAGAISLDLTLASTPATKVYSGEANSLWLDVGTSASGTAASALDFYAFGQVYVP